MFHGNGIIYLHVFVDSCYDNTRYIANIPVPLIRHGYDYGCFIGKPGTKFLHSGPEFLLGLSKEAIMLRAACAFVVVCIGGVFQTLCQQQQDQEEEEEEEQRQQQQPQPQPQPQSQSQQTQQHQQQ